MSSAGPQASAKECQENHLQKVGMGWRHIQALLLFTGLLLAYMMRVNMSMAIVAMTDSSDPDAFTWSVSTQSVILSSFFWGYVMLQVPGGELSARFGGKVLVLTSVGINSVVSLFMPLAAYYGGWQMVCACRVLQGLTQGVIYPSFHTLIGKWVPLEEKSTLGTFIYAGGQLGTAVQMLSAGFVAEAWGWPAIFYLNGSLGVLWTVLFLIFGAASPQTCARISHKERIYIQTSLGHFGKQKKFKTPWKTVFTSFPFLALIIVHCGQNWGYWTLMTEMPSYFSKVLGVNIKSNGMLSALPYISTVIVSFPLGVLADYMLKKQWASVTAVRKIFNSIGLYGPAVALIGLSYAPAGNVAVASAILTVVVALNAGHFMGYMLVHIDMAPNFAGTLMGITNGLGTVTSIVAPLAAGVIIKDETSAADWLKVFYVASAIYIVTNTIYVLFGTSERQSWNEPNNGTDDGEAIENKEPDITKY